MLGIYCYYYRIKKTKKNSHTSILVAKNTQNSCYIEDVKDLQFRIENGELPDLTNILQEKDELAYGEKVQ